MINNILFSATSKFQKTKVSVNILQDLNDYVEEFCFHVRRESQYKITKSEVFDELLKIFQSLKLNPDTIVNEDALKSQFDFIRKQIENYRKVGT